MTACLICAFTLHNSVKENAFRLASFVQLTLLRFIMPIIFVVGSAHFAPLSCLCVLLYMHFRNLSYLESKGFLVMPERKIPSFSFIQILMFAPMVIVLSVVQNNIIYGEVWAYYCAVYAGWSIASTARVRTGW
jgi:hypothetical protein